MKYDYLIVGSGLFGSTFAYRAKLAGKRCLMVEKRSHLGGNVYCEQIEGINVHKYGAHIFHTNNKMVWDFVNSLVEFNRYTNCPVANYKGELYNLPFNMNTFSQMWGVRTPFEAQKKIEEQRLEAIQNLNPNADSNWEPANLEEQALTLVGKDIFEKLIKEYTEKQWGRDCKDLPSFIIKRLPVRLVFDNNYFNDRYQGIPIGGYNKLINALLEGIDTITNCDFFSSCLEENATFGKTINGIPSNYTVIDVPQEYSLCNTWRKYAKNLVFCGPIDEFFGYQYGPLDWRTVVFKTRVENSPNYQGNAVVNYTSHEQPYTRVIEHKHFEMFGQEVYDCPKTVISEEYSTEYEPGMEPFYPVNDERNNILLAKYMDHARTQGILFPEDFKSCLSGKDKKCAGTQGVVLFGGRLAQYKYFDMAPIIEQVLSIQF